MLPIPNTTESLFPGDTIRLGRFSNYEWVVCFGWYSFAGNRPVCGWYLSKKDSKDIKPIQLPDLQDIIIIERGRR